MNKRDPKDSEKIIGVKIMKTSIAEYLELVYGMKLT
jgi:hypothetical protein